MFKIPREMIIQLTASQLPELVNDLIYAEKFQAARQGIEIHVSVSSRTAASDGGCDIFTKVADGQSWGRIEAGETCWQLKSGSAGQPSKIEHEVAKKVPKTTLNSGGHYKLVASAADGEGARTARLASLEQGARREHLSPSNISVMLANDIAEWCEEHPALVCKHIGGPPQLRLFGDWSRFELHRGRWHGSPTIDAKFCDIDGFLQSSGSPRHIHVWGKPGVGKTRFVLEYCRSREWAYDVLYLSQADEEILAKAVSSMRLLANSRLMLVVDEVEVADLDRMRTYLQPIEERLTLVTIGLGRPYPQDRISGIEIPPMKPDELRTTIHALHTGMPSETVDFIVKFADGFLRLAILAAQYLEANRELDVRSLYQDREIEAFLEKMLGGEISKYLYVVAILMRVGWSGDLEHEGRLIAQHLGFNWNEVRVAVDQLHKKYGVAPQAGRYRYISPLPLGNYLAIGAMRTLETEVESLLNALPQGMRDAHLDRLEQIGCGPRGYSLSKKKLREFSSIENLVDPEGARYWKAFSMGAPQDAALHIEDLLRHAPLDQRIQLSGEARGTIVWRLAELAWKRATFRSAMCALAYLAEAENENWGNNATSEFLLRYQILLGATSVPYKERLEVLAELLELQRPTIDRLVLRAVSRCGEVTHFSRFDSPSGRDSPPEPEYMPASIESDVRAGLGLFSKLIAKKFSHLENDIIDAIGEMSQLLGADSLYLDFIKIIESVKDAYPAAREGLRRVVHAFLEQAEQFNEDHGGAHHAALQRLYSELRDSSLLARLQENLSESPFSARGTADQEAAVRALAVEMSELRDYQSPEWRWLLSGEAQNGYALGEALAQLEAQDELCEFLSSPPDTGDMRLFGSYFHALRRRFGEAWYDRWFAETAIPESSRGEFLIEVAWRAGLTNSSARSLAAVLARSRQDRPTVSMLGYGSWSNQLDKESLKILLDVLLQQGHFLVSLIIIEHRLRSRMEEYEFWEGALLSLVIRPDLIRLEHAHAYHWRNAAVMLLSRNLEVICRAIITEHCRRDPEIWQIAYTAAEDVLERSMSIEAHVIWEIIATALQDPDRGSLFPIGFPCQIVSKAPATDVVRWIHGDPEKRASRIAGMLDFDFSSDDTVASRVLAEFGDEVSLFKDFFGYFISGTFWGAPSEHWLSQAAKLRAVAAQTRHRRLRTWAEKAAARLEDMAQGERQWEEEEEIPR